MLSATIIRFRRLFLLPLDSLFVFASFYLAFLIRFEGTIPPKWDELYWTGLTVSLGIKPVFFIFAGFYRRLWRYASISELLLVIKTVFFGCLVTAILTLFLLHFEKYSRSIVIIDWMLLNVFIMSRSLAWRVGREYFLRARHNKGEAILIIGAGSAGRMLLQEIRNNNAMEYSVVGFLDDDPAKNGVNISGVPVLGPLDSLATVVRKKQVKQVIIALPSARAKLLRDVVRWSRQCRVSIKTLPAISKLLTMDPLSSQIRNVDIEDLLGRDPVHLDTGEIRRFLEGKKVLITGAAGSIGSEISRQVALYQPAEIILFDNAETPLFHIERELGSKFPELPLTAVIGDIRYRARVEAVFREFLPDVVFHAAAYKHVPMMEQNPAEAVNNNVRGTMILAQTADWLRVQHFIMISTDKAVNPVNIMGASKRAAEAYVQTKARTSRTKFITVRFGNVLDSSGSVIPIFKEQIKNGGPVTVTHQEVIRYFMTIPEATQLVLQAATMGKGGEIFLLDMGEPVKITELAEELIRLSGLRPYEDIDIVFSGLRPGEKLYEELLLAGEGIVPTSHEKICIAKATHHDATVLDQQLEELFGDARAMKQLNVVAKLQEIVPEFQPQHHLFTGSSNNVIRLKNVKKST